MCAVAIGVGVVSCKKEQAVQTTTVKLDETIPSDDEAIAKELFAMHSSLTKKNKANDKIKNEVDKTPKEINKAVFLIEAYLNYEYDDSTTFEYTTVDTSYITIPASLVNNKYQVDYSTFIEAYNHSEIETLSHQQREKLRLTDPTVVVIDIELVTPESPVLATKDFVTRVVTVMGYKQIASTQLAFSCNFNDNEDYWVFNCFYYGGAPNLDSFLGKCGGTTPIDGYISCAEKEIDKRLNYCNATCNAGSNYYTNINSSEIWGGSTSPYPLLYWRSAPSGPILECFNPTKMNEQRNAIQFYAENLRPSGKKVISYGVNSFGAYVIGSGNAQNIRCDIKFGKCTKKGYDLLKL